MDILLDEGNAFEAKNGNGATVNRVFPLWNHVKIRTARWLQKTCSNTFTIADDKKPTPLYY